MVMVITIFIESLLWSAQPVLSTFLYHLHLIFTKTICDKYDCYLHLTDEQMKFREVK